MKVCLGNTVVKEEDLTFQKTASGKLNSKTSSE